MLYLWKPSGQIEIVRTEKDFQKSNLISVLYLHTPVFSPETAHISTQFGRLNDYGQFEPESDPVLMIGKELGCVYEWVCTVPTSMLTEDGTIAFSFSATVLSGQVDGENVYASITSGVISRYVNPSAGGIPSPPIDLLTQLQEDVAYLYDHIGGIVKSVSEVFPDENGNVPLIVFSAPENPQAGQLFFDNEGVGSEMAFTVETYDNTYNAPLNDDGENDFTAETYGATYELPQNGETLFTSETYGETYTETNSETLFSNGLNENNFGE